MNCLLENAADTVGVILQGLPTATVDASGSWDTIGPNEDFVAAAVRVLVGIVQRGPYQDKASMARNISSQGESVIQGMIDSGKLILIVVQEGDVTIYSQHHRNKLPKLARSLEASRFRLFGDSTVSWCDRLDGSPVETNIDTVLGGKNPVVDKPEKTGKELGPRAKAELRQKFWGQGGASPKGEPGEWDQSHAEEIVNKLLQ